MSRVKFVTTGASRQNANNVGVTLCSMMHASTTTLQDLSPLLDRLRSFEQLHEKTPGSFYRQSRAFLHFHEDAHDIFVDVRLVPAGPFTRLRITTKRERSAFFAQVKRALAQY